MYTLFSTVCAWGGLSGRRSVRQAHHTPAASAARGARRGPAVGHRPGRGRCVSMFLDKNKRYIGKSQLRRPHKRTQRPPHPAHAREQPRAVLGARLPGPLQPRLARRLRACTATSAVAHRPARLSSPRPSQRAGLSTGAMELGRRHSGIDCRPWSLTRHVSAARAGGTVALIPLTDSASSGPQRPCRDMVICICPMRWRQDRSSPPRPASGRVVLACARQLARRKAW